jgi:putative protein-disulfide isomerase
MKIYYFYDALCGWCYGFSDVLLKLSEKWKDRVSFEVISGGMITGERVGPLSQMAPYIKSAYKTVEERSGVKFGDVFVNDVLEKGEVILDSLPPSKALSVLKHMKLESSVLFAHQIQNAFYYYGKNLNEINTYLEITEKAGLNTDDFSLLYHSELSKTKTEEDYYLTQQFGISGFPTMIAHHDGQYFLLARGYSDFELVDKTIFKILNGIPASQ